jgi:hypothetical protein
MRCVWATKLPKYNQNPQVLTGTCGFFNAHKYSYYLWVLYSRIWVWLFSSWVLIPTDPSYPRVHSWYALCQTDMGRDRAGNCRFPRNLLRKMLFPSWAWCRPSDSVALVLSCPTKGPHKWWMAFVALPFSFDFTPHLKLSKTVSRPRRSRPLIPSLHTSCILKSSPAFRTTMQYFEQFNVYWEATMLDFLQMGVGIININLKMILW